MHDPAGGRGTAFEDEAEAQPTLSWSPNSSRRPPKAKPTASWSQDRLPDVQQIAPILGFSEKFLYTYTKKLPSAQFSWQVICNAPRGRLKVCASAQGLLAVGMADPQDAHISVERIKQVVNNCDLFLADAEQAHMCGCLECLKRFTALVLHRDDEGDSLSA